MSLETAQKGLEMAFGSGASIVQVGFFGGEPMLRWDLMREMTSLCECKEEQNHISAHKTYGW